MRNTRINKAALRAFIHRKRSNALGLSIITAASAVITLLCALTGFARTRILLIITILLVLLCVVMMLRRGKGFRTLRFSKRLRKKKNPPEAE